jgi:hypothetical protein
MNDKLSEAQRTFAVLLVFVSIPGISGVQAGGPHLHGPVMESAPHRCAGCANGLCTPSSKFGHYRTMWRRWPGASDYFGVGSRHPAVGTPDAEVPDAINEGRIEPRTRSTPTDTDGNGLPSASNLDDPFVTVPEDEGPNLGGATPSASDAFTPPIGGFGEPTNSQPAPFQEIDPIFAPDGGFDNDTEDALPNMNPETDLDTDFPFQPLNEAPGDSLDLGRRDAQFNQQLARYQDRAEKSMPNTSVSSVREITPHLPFENESGFAANANPEPTSFRDDILTTPVERVSFEDPLGNPDELPELDAYSRNPLRGKLRRGTDNIPLVVEPLRPEVKITPAPSSREPILPQHISETVAPRHIPSSNAPQVQGKLAVGKNLRETLRKNPLR